MNSQKKHFYPAALTIAGSDSGGGAGIAADLRTFNALGVFGCCAITAVTSQNPASVSRIDPVPAEGVAAQIKAVTDKISISYAKTGMLFSSETVLAVANEIKRCALKIVCDPVMVSTSGSVLLKEDAIETMKSELFPLAKWITPNIPEAELILGTKISGVDDMFEAALTLSNTYKTSVLLKGGHLKSDNICDTVAKDGKVYLLSSPQLEVPPFASHGTGCTLSAALAAALALDFPWKRAICESKAFVFGSLSQCVEIGKNVYAMYPPVEDSLPLIKLSLVE